MWSSGLAGLGAGGAFLGGAIVLIFGKDGIMFGIVGLWSCTLGGTVGVGIGPELIWVGCGPLVVGKPVGIVPEP